MWMYLWVVGLLAAIAALRSYHFMTGRNALLDLRDKLRLQSRSISAWDDYCARNPNRSDIVICLTTTPSRITRLEGTLKSLLYQSRRPQAIRLHIPDYSQREQRPYPIPAYLCELKSVEIVRCVDFGPATKLIPALEAYESQQLLLIVDDDRLYPPDLVETFARAAAAMPDAALGMSGWIVPDDLTDRPATLLDHIRQRTPAPVKSTRMQQSRRVDILLGYAGYLVRPAFFARAALVDYSGAPTAAFYVDDVWIGAHCTAPKYVVPARRHCAIPRKDWFLHDRTALYRLNAGGGDPEQRNNTIMIRYFKERWLCAR